jgi:hypothetical protein
MFGLFMHEPDTAPASHRLSTIDYLGSALIPKPATRSHAAPGGQNLVLIKWLPMIY